jgi:hypothetical protein
MRSVRVVEMVADEVVDVIAVGNCFVSATRTVLMVRGVLGARVGGSATSGGVNVLGHEGLRVRSTVQRLMN